MYVSHHINTSVTSINYQKSWQFFQWVATPQRIFSWRKQKFVWPIYMLNFPNSNILTFPFLHQVPISCNCKLHNLTTEHRAISHIPQESKFIILFFLISVRFSQNFLLSNSFFFLSLCWVELSDFSYRWFSENKTKFILRKWFASMWKNLDNRLSRQ